MNHFDREFTGEAKLEYGDADYLILSPGAYVVCAVTGSKIPLNDLRYWSAELQEAYQDGPTATQRWMEIHTGPGVKEGESQ
ncbi:hypothetical protein GCM10011367_02710 [Marinicauda pacifica]|jgi:hypothetical protein|uniref:DUF2093 domain-containing protein n=1 Tax=Marinicauda pacifica TaxID=1133559 RepID=A0A4S2HED0_9PROT|nr:MULTISPECIES: DUF2093 domain-containing protein [Marinicauda]TGY93962.1 DUF2093 domain-containing protein [Marinicauda pacifica]GGE31742.1 hypothetical protein GCM10011367_02710 [Marinicauda pacifica]